MTTTATQKRNAYLAWVAVCFIWGTTYLGIKIALETIPPFALGGIRFATAGLVLATVRLLQGKKMPTMRGLLDAAIAGFLLLGFGNGGVVWAEQYVPSGLAAVLVAAVAFWMVGVEAHASEPDRAPRRIQWNRVARVARSPLRRRIRLGLRAWRIGAAAGLLRLGARIVLWPPSSRDG